MIQDLENHIFHNEYQPVPPKKTDCILYYEKHLSLIHIFQFPFLLPPHSPLPQVQRPDPESGSPP